MPRSATFYVSNWPNFLNKVYGASGQNHAGLECDRGAGQPFYVTWDGTVRGADWSDSKYRLAKLPGATTLLKMPAHMKVGFAEINKMNLTTVRMEPADNPRSFVGFNPPTPQTDFQIPGRTPGSIVSIPTLKVPIPVRSPGGVAATAADELFGLDVEAIWNWWFEILMLPPDDPRRSYCRFSTMRDTAVNCCGMVGLALLKGGLGNYASPPTNVFFQGAASLQRWIQKGVKRIEALNQQRKTIMASIDYQRVNAFNDGEQQPDFHGYPDLPSLDAWKRRSAVQEGLKTGFARRKEQVAEIDRLLPLYHAARRVGPPTGAGTPTHPPAPAGPSWMELLTNIHEQCFQHLAEKPTSDRRQAMLALAKTIHDAISGYNWYQDDLANAYTPRPETFTGWVGGYNRP